MEKKINFLFLLSSFFDYDRIFHIEKDFFNW